MQQSTVADPDPALDLQAVALGLRYKLPLADSIVHAITQHANAIVWTQDADFEGLAGVRFWRKQ